eukprot:GFUD01010760.1.p1 GENE.GFUD01010760.1~~GFUD01010760.1.p1  ORF type:complete len:344 (-),score=29.20 GFUD01010760.1:291-1322(-)
MTAASIMSYPSYVNPQALTMFNVSTLLNQKDSRWLQLEVCREFQRQKCTRSDAECKFAHPPPNVEVQNGRVTACYDSIKGRCNREKPACKYFHPPQHLKDQLLINGRNHLALKNALAQQMQQQLIPGQIPAVFGAPYVGASVPLTYSPYLPGLVSPLIGSEQQILSHQPQPTQQQPQLQQKQRSDRIEPVVGMTMPVPGGGQATLSGCLPNPTVAVSMAQQQPLSASVAQSTLAGALPHSGHPGSMSQPILPNMLTSPFGLQHLSQEQLQQLAIASFGGGKKRPRDPGDDLVLVLISLPLVLSPKSQKGMIDPGNLPTKIFLVVIPSWISNINNWQNSPKFGT